MLKYIMAVLGGIYDIMELRDLFYYIIIMHYGVRECLV